MSEDLAAFCAREHQRLVGALYLYCGDRGVAEDLSQEALARACRDWEHVRGLARPGAWAHHVAMNLARSHFRRRAAERRANRRSVMPDHTVPDVSDRIAVRQALLALPERQRRVLILRYYLGHSVAETAGLLGAPEGTIKTATFRALATLRTLLADATIEAADA